MRLLTAEEKDRFTKFIAENSPLGEQVMAGIDQLKDGTGFDENESRAMLKYLESMGLVSHYSDYRVCLSFSSTVDLHDFIQSGGFVMRELLYDVELKKMQLEIDKLLMDLKPDHLETVNKISSVVGNTITAFSAFLNVR